MMYFYYVIYDPEQDLYFGDQPSYLVDLEYAHRFITMEEAKISLLSFEVIKKVRCQLEVLP